MALLVLKRKSVLAVALVSFAIPSLLNLHSSIPVSLFAAAWSSRSQHGKVPSPSSASGSQRANNKLLLPQLQIKQPPVTATVTATRRNVLRSIQLAVVPSIFLSNTVIAADASSVQDSEQLAILPRQNYHYSEEWAGTSLQLLSPTDAAVVAASGNRFPFAHWPDPILRRPASVVTVPSSLSRSELRMIAQVLRKTARHYGAVGLAAQQCGIDVSLVFLDTAAPAAAQSSANFAPRKRRNDLSPPEQKERDDSDEDGIFLVNPRIVARSPEQDMKIWTEHCLVLPPTFDATVLRDDSVTIAHERLKDGKASFVTLNGELARAAQHEMDHDRGILILDHVGLEDMESDKMRLLETDGHRDRQLVAFERSLAASPLYATTNARTESPSLQKWTNNWLQPQPANAVEEDLQQQQPKPTECDDECIAKRKKIIAERRAMMMQARTTTKRQDMFDLSRQRATLYNTTYQGASCAPGVPCL